MLFLELVGQVIDDAHVKVFATQERVAVGGFHFEQAVVDFQNGHVERSAAKVIHRDGVGVFLVQTIGQSGGCRFVDDAQHFKAGNLAGVLGGLTLSVIEIGRDGDDGLRHFFAKVGFGGFLHLAKNEGRDLRGAVFVAARFDPGIAVAAIDDVERHVLLVLGKIGIVEPTANQALDAKDGVFGVGDGLAFRRLADKAFVIRESHDRGCGACTFRVLDHLGLRAIHDGHTRVRCTEVDTDHFAHFRSLLN